MARQVEAMEPAPEPEPRPSPEEQEQEARAEARATLESYGLDGSAGGEEKPTKPKTLAPSDGDALRASQLLGEFDRDQNGVLDKDELGEIVASDAMHDEPIPTAKAVFSAIGHGEQFSEEEVAQLATATGSDVASARRRLEEAGGDLRLALERASRAQPQPQPEPEPEPEPAAPTPADWARESTDADVVPRERAGSAATQHFRQSVHRVQAAHSQESPSLMPHLNLRSHKPASPASPRYPAGSAAAKLSATLDTVLATKQQGRMMILHHMFREMNDQLKAREAKVNGLRERLEGRIKTQRERRKFVLEELGKIEAELLQHREQSTCTTFEPADLESQTHDYPSWRQERLRVATAQLEQAQRAQQPPGRGRQSTEAALADIDDIIDTVTDSLGGGKPAADGLPPPAAGEAKMLPVVRAAVEQHKHPRHQPTLAELQAEVDALERLNARPGMTSRPRQLVENSGNRLIQPLAERMTKVEQNREKHLGGVPDQLHWHADAMFTLLRLLEQTSSTVGRHAEKRRHSRSRTMAARERQISDQDHLRRPPLERTAHQRARASTAAYSWEDPHSLAARHDGPEGPSAGKVLQLLRLPSGLQPSRHLATQERAQLEEQLQRARARFDEMDKDGNGVLSGKELHALARMVFSDNTQLTKREQEVEAAKVLTLLDRNNDGMLDFDEFAHWFTRAAVSIGRVTTTAYSGLDKDGDGKLDFVSEGTMDRTMSTL